MDSSSLKGVVNKGFLRRIQVASSTGRDEARSANPNNASVNVGLSLQSGQVAFSLAIQRLNHAGEFLSVSTDTMEKLLKLTDRAIDLAEEAASTGSSDAKRYALNKDFKQVAQEFRKTVRGATFDSAKVLTKEELADELEKAGLDRKASIGVADLYGKLLENPEDDLFASELTRGKRPVSIPESAYIGPLVSSGGGGPVGETTYTYGATQVSANAESQNMTFGSPTMISANVAGTSGSYGASSLTNSTAPTVTDSGYVTDAGYVAITESSGTYQIEGFNGSPFTSVLTGAASIVAVNEASGYFVLQSSEDFLSYNPDNVNQLFLADSSGNIVHQYTTFASGDSITYGDVDLVDTNQTSATIIYSYQTAAGGTDLFIKTATPGTIGEDPSTSSHVTVDSGASASLGNIGVAYGDVTINEAGTYIAYARYETSFNPATQYSVQFLDTGTLTANSLLATTQFASMDTLGFATTDSLFVLKDAGGGVRDVFAVDYVDGSFGTAILTNLDVGGFVTGEARSGSGAGFFAATDLASYDITLYDNTGTQLYTYDGTGTDAIQHRNIAAIDSNNKPKLGVFGITDLFGAQTDNELYAVSYEFGILAKVGQTGIITSVSDIYETDYANPEDHLFIHAIGGSTTDVSAGTAAFTLKGVNASTGYSVIESTEDFLSYNGSNLNQLFLVDAGGTIVQQLTNFAQPREYGEVAIDSSNQVFVFAEYDSSTGDSNLQRGTLSSLGVDPAMISLTSFEQVAASVGVTEFSSVSVSSDGVYVAAVSNNSGASLWESATGIFDTTLHNDAEVTALGFIDGNKLALLRDSDANGSSDTVSTFVAGDGSYNTIAAALDVGLFTTLEKGSGSKGYFAFTLVSAGDENDVYLTDDTGLFQGKVELDATNDITRRISLAYDPVSGTPDVGIYGSIAALDPVDQLYRVETSAGGATGLVGQSGLIASAYNVYSSFDTATPETTSYVNAAGGGTVAGPVDPAAFPVLAVHEATGSYIIASTQDFLGQNNSNLNQLFLVDETGTVIHQYTDNFAPSVEYFAVDFSGTRETIAYSEKSPPFSSVYKVEVGVLGEAPSTSTFTMIAGGKGGDIDKVKINDDGSHVAYSLVGSGQIYIDGSVSTDLWLTADTSNVDFGFTDLNTLAIARNLDVDVYADQVVEYELNSSVYSAPRVGGVNISAFTTLEKGSHADAFFAYANVSGGLAQDVSVRYATTGTAAGGFDGSGIDNISTVSLAYNPLEEIEVGLFGVVESINNDTDAELYRLEVTASTPGGGGGGGDVYSTLPKLENDADKIFSRSILTRPEAYRVLNDLKALREQIRTNLDTLEATTKYVAENVKLARVAGTAFIEAADSSSATSSPEAAVLRIRELLQQNGSGVLDQLENLDRVAVNALTRD